MISDLNICRAAKLLVDQYGAKAVARATERADGLLDDGDAEGAAIWRQKLRERCVLVRKKSTFLARNAPASPILVQANAVAKGLGLVTAPFFWQTQPNKSVIGRMSVEILQEVVTDAP
jgi:hypothetical protein